MIFYNLSRQVIDIKKYFKIHFFFRSYICTLCCIAFMEEIDSFKQGISFSLYFIMVLFSQKKKIKKTKFIYTHFNIIHIM